MEQQQRRDTANIPGDQHQLKTPTSVPSCQTLNNIWQGKLTVATHTTKQYRDI